MTARWGTMRYHHGMTSIWAFPSSAGFSNRRLLLERSSEMYLARVSQLHLAFRLHGPGYSCFRPRYSHSHSIIVGIGVHRIGASGRFIGITQPVDGVDPLVFARCGAEVRVISFIKGPAVLRPNLRASRCFGPPPGGARPASSAYDPAKRRYLTAWSDLGR